MIRFVMPVSLTSTLSRTRARGLASRCANFNLMRLLQLWMLFMAVVSNADALMLGDIQVNSRLGQPFSARVAFIDITGVDPLQLKLQLASVEEYKKLDLQYPVGNRFRFQVVNMQGALVPFIRISTQYPVNDPFIDLLLEVSAASGKVVKSYTVLLDPPTDYQTPIAAPRATPSAIPSAAEQRPAAASGTVAATTENPPESVAKLQTKHSHHHRHSTTSTTAHSEKTVLHGQSHMKLAMSLSISKYSPATPANPKDAADALQEELIAKQKTLEDLQLQISEMQSVLMRLHNPDGQDSQAGSTVAAASVAKDIVAASNAATTETAEKTVAASQVKVQKSNPVQNKPPIVQPDPEVTAVSDWLNPILAVVVLLLGAAALIGYRKYRQMHAWAHGPFDDINDELAEEENNVPFHQNKLVVPGPLPSTETQLHQSVATAPPVVPVAPVVEAAPAVAEEPVPEAEKPSLTFGERSAEMQAYSEPASTPIVPPEYAILMEANKYLRAGKEQLAEEALIRAIEVNPKNSYGYFALLKIYAAHNDKLSFEKIAMQLMQIAGATAFEEVAEMGRQLDPQNPLYA